MTQDRLRGHLNALLLATLAAGPAHGYALAQSLRIASDDQLAIPEGSLYPALRRLEAEQLVESQWDTTTKRRRRIYEITARGKETLVEERRAWRQLKTSIDTVLEAST